MRWSRVLAVAYMAALLVASLLPGPPVRAVPDLAQHALAYAGLTGVLWQTVPASGRRWMVAPVAWGYGITLELLQRTVSYRTADVRDVAANGVGVLVATLLAFAFSSRRLATFRP
ncbi:MAG: VanZ family protein [Firmicutes bacterium]|nr:VanZ family protein [Bacillota bacterium]